MNYKKNHSGFSLVEMVMVIVLTGIIATITVQFISQPVQLYVDQANRGDLVDIVQTALHRMTRDIRRALPNSIRIVPEGNGNGTVLEYINIKQGGGGRYREGPGPGTLATPACRLNFIIPPGDTSFAVPGGITGALAAGDRIVISNWNNTGPTANAYAGDNITPAATTLTLNAPDATCSEPYITLSAPFLFPFPSPRQRFYIADNPVAYLCDTGAGTIRRYQNQAITLNQTSVDTDAELGVSALLVDNVTACAFTYNPGTATRGALVTLSITASQAGESVTLVQQIHVNNIP